MKNRIIDLVLIILIVGLFLSFFLVDKSRVQNSVAPTPSIPTSSLKKNPSQDTVFAQKIEVVNYSQEGAKIKLGFVNATATKETLKVTLSISGIDFSNSPDAFSNLVCNPNITTEEEVQKVFTSIEGYEGDPKQITYVYDLRGNTYQTLHAEMDWTIGPCGTYMNEGQSNATPFPTKLMTNYHFVFEVPVK